MTHQQAAHADVPEISEAVSQRLARFIADQREAAVAESPSAALVIDAAGSAVSGGKRLRARFCETGWRAVRPTDGAEAIIDAAASLELFQAAALVHDDIIDRSDTRRGRPAAHRALEASHRELGWAGDAAAFGVSAAILLGDLLVAFSDDLFEQSLTALRSPALARAEYARMRRDVTVGQYLDIAQESAWVTQPATEHADRAMEIASMKSARYSVQQPLVLGGAIGAGSEAAIEALRAFGLPVGLAFQLRDDLLGVFGDPEVTGKPAGDDLREGKRTLLIAYAREGMDAAARADLDAKLGSTSLDASDITGLQQAILATGAAQRVEEQILAHARAAEAVLADAPFDADAARDLQQLLIAATQRSA